KLIGQLGKVPPPLAFAVIRQAVEGLAEAHKLGIVHRDVKPGNLLIARSGVVKVTDLGLAMVVSDRLSRNASDSRRDGLPAGTAAPPGPWPRRSWPSWARREVGPTESQKPSRHGVPRAAWFFVPGIFHRASFAWSGPLTL